TGRSSRASRARRKSKPRHPAWEKFVEPFDEMTPAALAGPGESRPTARILPRGTPVRARIPSKASWSAWIATSGPSWTRLGVSTIWSTRKPPVGVRTVALFLLPPLSWPTTNHSSSMGIGTGILPGIRLESARRPGEGGNLPLEGFGHARDGLTHSRRETASPRLEGTAEDGVHDRQRRQLPERARRLDGLREPPGVRRGAQEDRGKGLTVGFETAHGAWLPAGGRVHHDDARSVAAAGRVGSAASS